MCSACIRLTRPAVAYATSAGTKERRRGISDCPATIFLAAAYAASPSPAPAANRASEVYATSDGFTPAM